MFPSLSRRPKGSKAEGQSPFSSPYSNIQASPIAARRTSLEERRRPAAKFDRLLSPDSANRIEEEEEDDEEQEDDDQDEDINEDDAGELSPLLPIFSAAHLGTLYPSVGVLDACSLWRQIRCRCTTSPIPYDCLSFLDARLPSHGINYGHLRCLNSSSNPSSNRYGIRTFPRLRCTL